MSTSIPRKICIKSYVDNSLYKHNSSSLEQIKIKKKLKQLQTRSLTNQAEKLTTLQTIIKTMNCFIFFTLNEYDEFIYHLIKCVVT